jgi:hypothetical protein
MFAVPFANQRARPGRTIDPARAWAIIAVLTFVAVATTGMIAYPYPSPFDELQHYSVVRAQFEHPDLFADPRAYMIVDPAAPTQWIGQRNYINHPSFYYIALSPLLLVGDGVTALRLANVILAGSALALTIAAGWHLLRDKTERIAFAIIAACFPKAMLIAGMINNDNLAMLAAALVFAGLAGMRRPGLLIALGLALAGWTKLTALIGLAALVAVWLLFDRRRVFARDSWLAAGGVAIGFTPFIAMKIRTGVMVPVNVEAFGVPLEQRPHWQFAEYARHFLGNFATKWPAGDDTMPMSVAAALVVFPLLLAIMGALTASPARRLIIATLAAIAITFAIHIGFGWQSFQAIGDITIAQTRYYNIVWPGLALGGAVAIGRLKRFVPPPILIAPYLAPTILGVTAMMMVERVYG